MAVHVGPTAFATAAGDLGAREAWRYCFSLHVRHPTLPC